MSNNNTKNVASKGEGDNEGERRKKMFDKKKYRLQKYSNKYKIDQWENRRKKAVIREFYKELKKDRQNSAQNTPLESGDPSRSEEGTTKKSKERSYAFHKARREYLRKEEERKKRLEEMARVKGEREEALRKYKEKKIRVFKALSKKTRKGQPVMKDRMELLFEKIQETIQKDR